MSRATYFSVPIDWNSSNILGRVLIVIGKSIIEEREHSLDILLENIQTSIRASIERVANFRLAFQLVKLVHVADNLQANLNYFCAQKLVMFTAYKMRYVVHVSARRKCVEANGVKSVEVKVDQ